VSKGPIFLQNEHTPVEETVVVAGTAAVAGVAA